RKCFAHHKERETYLSLRCLRDPFLHKRATDPFAGKETPGFVTCRFFRRRSPLHSGHERPWSLVFLRRARSLKESCFLRVRQFRETNAPNFDLPCRTRP